MSPQSIDRRRRLRLAALALALGGPVLPVAGQDAERAPVCDTKLKLGATFYLHDQPDDSLAMLRIPNKPNAGLYRRGMYVEGFEVVSVEPRGVLLAREDAYCWLRLQPDPSRPAPTPPPERRRPKRKR